MSSNNLLDQLPKDQSLGKENFELLEMLRNQDRKMNNLQSSGKEKQQHIENEYNSQLSKVSDSISELEKEIDQYKRYIPAVHKEIDAYLTKKATETADCLQEEYDRLCSNLYDAQNQSRKYSQYQLRIGSALYDSLFDKDRDGICRVFSIIGVALCCVILLIMTLFAIIQNMQQGAYFSDLMFKYKSLLLILCAGAAGFVVSSFVISFIKEAKAVRDVNQQEDDNQAAFEADRDTNIRECQDELDQWKEEHSSWLTNDEFDWENVYQLNWQFSKDTIADAIRESEEKVKRRMEFNPTFSVYKFEIKSSHLIK